MRPLTAELEALSLGQNPERDPAFQVEVFDVRSTSDTIRDVINGVLNDPDTGPFDVTDYVTEAIISERAGDYLNSGVSASEVVVSLVDPEGQFDPSLVIDDPAALGRFFRSGNVVRIREGDARVAQGQWPLTFTGLIAGQSGYQRSRAVGISELRFRALGREATFIKYDRTTDVFSIGTTYRDVALSVAENEMGLDPTIEVNYSLFGNQTVRHTAVQMVKEDPMSMTAKVMFVDGRLPKFNGAGVLIDSSVIISNSSDRIYPDERNYIDIQRPISDVVPPDSVRVLGLAADLSLVQQPRQLLAEVNVTTGYFTSNEDITAFFSDDQTQLAKNIQFVVKKSVALGGLGGGENFVTIPSPSPNQEGSIGVNITIDTGFAPWLGIFLLITYVALAAIPDITIPLVGTTTIPVGRIAQATALSGALQVMTQLGRGQYELYGEPFEYVYKEIRGRARVAGVGNFETNEVEVQNHWIVTQTDADDVARETLFRQLARANPRPVTMFFDYALEVDDTFEDLVTRRRFLISTISRSLVRDSDQQLATYGCLEITDNVALST